MSENPLLAVQSFGQSIWLDFLHRRILENGELQKMIEEDGLRGVTSNPKIFHDAIGDGEAYEDAIRLLAAKGRSALEIYETLALEDVRRAADLFLKLYEDSEGSHGFVSLEVNPHLAYDASKTIAEAQRLWQGLDRPNVFIKVPATREGLTAIRQLIAEGVNVNVTLLFGLPRYREVAEAYMAGLEERAGRGEPLERIASVASFFLSRIDVLVDPLLEEKMKIEGAEQGIAKVLHGQTAIASAKQAYQIYKKVVSGNRFRKLAEKGGRPQRVLWASTGAKNPAYSDVKYLEPLIGPETVNTAPKKTLDAYRDHGRPEPRLEKEPDFAEYVLRQLPNLGLDIDRLAQQLEDEGVEKFIKPYDQLMKILEERRNSAKPTAA